MFYEVRMTLYFLKEDEATDFYHDGEIALPKAGVVNPGQEDEEFSSIDLLENHHDDHPHQPCILLEHEDNKPD